MKELETRAIGKAEPVQDSFPEVSSMANCRRSVIYAGEDACATFTAARAANFPELNSYKKLFESPPDRLLYTIEYYSVDSTWRKNAPL